MAVAAVERNLSMQVFSEADGPGDPRGLRSFGCLGLQRAASFRNLGPWDIVCGLFFRVVGRAVVVSSFGFDVLYAWTLRLL